jgi:hypothetical protein
MCGLYAIGISVVHKIEAWYSPASAWERKNVEQELGDGLIKLLIIGVEGCRGYMVAIRLDINLRGSVYISQHG